MSIRQDEVQLKISFITDESRQLAKTLLETKKYNAEITASEERLKKYNKELARTKITEQERATLLAKVAAEEKNVALNLAKIAEAAKAVEKIDLSKLTPAQLTERARQLELALRRIPQSAPEFKSLQNELQGVNLKLKEIRDTSRGIKDNGPDGGGGIFGSIIGKVGIAFAAVQAFAASIQGLFNFAVEAVKDFNTGAAADAALEDRLRSTEGAVGRTIDQLQELANEQAKITLFDDDEIKKGEELLLTFTNIQSEIYDRTIPAALDMSTVFQQDVSASAIQLGKALNDPIQGISALSRIGITFSDEQKNTIRAMVEMNDVAAAQAVILGEVERQVGGAAQAAAKAEGGALKNLAKRAAEVKESLGGLISQGLKRLQPVAEVVIIIVEKLVESFTEGKAATGEYSTVVNILAGILKGVGLVIQAFAAQSLRMWQAITDTASAFGRFIDYLREIPVVGQYIDILLTPIRFLRDAIFNLPAAWAGFVAGVKQGAENMALEFRGLLLRVQAFAKEVQLAITFDEESKKKLEAQLTDIRTREAAAKAGRSVGQAYAEARDAVLAQAPAETSTTGNKRPGTRSVGGLDAEEAEKRRKSAADLQEKQFSAQLAAIEAQEKRKELLAEAARIKGQTTEQQYQQALSDIYTASLESRLDVYRRFGREQEAEALQIQNILLNIAGKNAVSELPGIDRKTGLTAVTTTQDDTNARLVIAGLANDTAQAALRSKFEDALIAEQDYNIRSLELQQAFLQQKLNILNSAQATDVAAVQKTEEQKRDIEQQIAGQRLENERRMSAFRQEVEDARQGALNEAISFGIQLLGRDEAARRKNAGIIKGFEIGQVLVQGISEVQKIFAKYAAIPGGQAIAIPEALRAGIRTAAAVAKIATTKFAVGGYTGRGYGLPDETGFRPAGIVHENEYVAPAWMTRNAETAPVIAWLESRRLRKYADGGLVSVSTTPTFQTYQAVGAGGAVSNAEMQQFTRAVYQFERIVAAFPTEVRSRVVYTEIEDAQTELNTVRSDAAI